MRILNLGGGFLDYLVKYLDWSSFKCIPINTFLREKPRKSREELWVEEGAEHTNTLFVCFFVCLSSGGKEGKEGNVKRKGNLLRSWIVQGPKTLKV